MNSAQARAIKLTRQPLKTVMASRTTEEGVSHVLDLSEGSSKLIPMDEESNLTGCAFSGRSYWIPGS